MTRRLIAIVPFEPAHYAMLQVRAEQMSGLELMMRCADRFAELGPAFSAVELDEKGDIAAVLACAGLAESKPPSDPSGGYATAWAGFAEGLRMAQWSPITHAIRAVIEGAEYARIDMLVRGDWPAAQRYAEALGFKFETMIYARAGGAAPAQGTV